MFKIRLLRKIKDSKTNSYKLLSEFSTNRRFSRFFKNKAEIKNEIYNTVKSLEKSGYITSSQKTENGRIKNYYTVTKKGDAVLKSAKKIFQRHFKELASLMS